MNVADSGPTREEVKRQIEERRNTEFCGVYELLLHDLEKCELSS